jgi:hypothetical protein
MAQLLAHTEPAVFTYVCGWGRGTLACVCVYEDPQRRVVEQAEKDLGLKVGELTELPVSCVLRCASGSTGSDTAGALGLKLQCIYWPSYWHTRN